LTPKDLQPRRHTAQMHDGTFSPAHSLLHILLPFPALLCFFKKEMWSSFKSFKSTMNRFLKTGSFSF
jgi:hypothetical protein